MSHDCRKHKVELAKRCDDDSDDDGAVATGGLVLQTVKRVKNISKITREKLSRTLL